MRTLTAMDIEVYPNATLIMFKRFETGELLTFEQFTDPESGQPILTIDIPALKKAILSSTLVTFNGIGYDLSLIHI